MVASTPDLVVHEFVRGRELSEKDFMSSTSTHKPIPPMPEETGGAETASSRKGNNNKKKRNNNSFVLGSSPSPVDSAPGAGDMAAAIVSSLFARVFAQIKKLTNNYFYSPHYFSIYLSLSLSLFTI
jgi:hypothetical protein